MGKHLILKLIHCLLIHVGVRACLLHDKALLRSAEYKTNHSKAGEKKGKGKFAGKSAAVWSF